MRKAVVEGWGHCGTLGFQPEAVSANPVPSAPGWNFKTSTLAQSSLAGSS